MERPAAAGPATGTKHLDIFVDEKEPRNGIEALLRELRPFWQPAEVKLKTFTDGITNKLVGCHVDQAMEDVVLVRIYGNMTELFVDRRNEVECFQVLHAHRCAPDLYCTFQNGICYKFIRGTVLNMWMLREPSIFRLVAKEMAHFHSVQTDNCYPMEPVLWKTLSKYLTLLNTSLPMPTSHVSSMEMNDLPTLDILVSETEVLKEHLSQVKSPVVLCHNDLLCKNIIYIETQGVSELDFSMYPPKEMQMDWLTSYLREYKEYTGCEPVVTDLEVLKLYVQVNKFTLASHFSWGLWAVLQARYSTIEFDFLRYARERFKQYFKKKDETFALQLPP
ncbi:ethanolamine kinase 1-like isoform X2 [Scyliorhinus canicula]|uniref:ethanolamine kinase 1-like isoform X2 n=1 Tax=Scyliorhinus canicula TaxID=7830 RepID=UPI0018F5267D|nr:ethanolamine kinase 1-like isoform X2 [Scyliorhinus canicula]